jgi:uncharacterized membrane protein
MLFSLVILIFLICLCGFMAFIKFGTILVDTCSNVLCLPIASNPYKNALSALVHLNHLEGLLE